MDEEETLSIRTNDTAMKFLAIKALSGIEKPDYSIAAEVDRSPQWASELKAKYPDYHEVLLELVLREVRGDLNAPIRGVWRAASKGDSAAFNSLMKFLGLMPDDKLTVDMRHDFAGLAEYARNGNGRGRSGDSVQVPVRPGVFCRDDTGNNSVPETEGGPGVSDNE